MNLSYSSGAIQYRSTKKVLFTMNYELFKKLCQQKFLVENDEFWRGLIALVVNNAEEYSKQCWAR